MAISHGLVLTSFDYLPIFKILTKMNLVTQWLEPGQR